MINPLPSAKYPSTDGAATGWRRIRASGFVARTGLRIAVSMTRFLLPALYRFTMLFVLSPH
jgi:hypothetical protein